MELKVMIEQKILDAFETMWGPFPEPVLLVHKDRTILATNELARVGGCSTGIKCFSRNPEAVTHACQNCKANLALREDRPVCAEETMGGQRIIGYWVPLKEIPDVFVHFGIGIAALMGIQPHPMIGETNAHLVNLNCDSHS
jgi:hypothetical protein